MYKIVYTPLFQRDLNEILDYIAGQLKNPIAANDFLDALEKKILSVSLFPTSLAPYPTTQKRPLPYYPMRVKNYTAFYVVTGDVIEFRRLLYSRSDLPAHLDS